MEFLSHFLNFFNFYWPKSCHSNLAITFFVDLVRPNGFHYHLDQVRNCPFRLPDDRWRHIRLRNGLLHNHENLRISASFSEKGMNLKMIKMPRNYSLVSFVWNRQPFLNVFIPKLILENFFRQNLGFLNDFFAYFSPQVFIMTKYYQFCMPIPYNRYQRIILRQFDDLWTQPFFLRECGNRTTFDPKYRTFLVKVPGSKSTGSNWFKIMKHLHNYDFRL